MVAALLVVQLSRNPLWKRELLLLGSAATFGIGFSFLLSRHVRYVPDIAGEIPLWTVALWVALAASFPRSLAWLQARPLTAAALGFVGGPIAHLSGSRLGALECISGDPAGVFVIAAGFALFCPLCATLSRVWLAESSRLGIQS